jgi:hypothetical protein
MLVSPSKPGKAAPPSLIGTLWSTVFATSILPTLSHGSHRGSACSLVRRSLRHAAVL